MPDDRDLMRNIARGDEGAVAQLYDRFGGLVYRMAYQLTPTKGDAEDAVQEIFIRLWQSAARFDPNRASLATWVMLLARRHLVDQLRRLKVRPRPMRLDESGANSIQQGRTSPTGSLLRRERRKRLEERIAALPELQREVIARAYLGGRTLREIGQELDKPIGTIKSALSRALSGLRDRVPAEEGLI